MKRSKNQCPLTPPGSKEKCPLRPAASKQEGSIVITRTDKRSWITLAITGFGALLLRYLRIVREKGFKTQRPSGKTQPKR